MIYITLRKILILNVMVCLLLFSTGSSVGSISGKSGSKKHNRYDGIGIEKIPRPQVPSRTKKALSGFSALRHRHDSKVNDTDSLNEYEKSIISSDMVFVPGRTKRVKKVIEHRICKEIRRHLNKLLSQEYQAGLAMSDEEYRRKRRLIDKLDAKKDKMWRFQYDMIDPNVQNRYDPEWDDIYIVRAGPITITDTGHVDLDTNWQTMKKWWQDGLGDVVLVPEPSPEAPARQLMVGKRIDFRTTGKIRISPSRLLKPFYKQNPGMWGDSLTNYKGYFRYLKLSLGLDFYTDILRRKYCRTELEVRVSPDLRWMTYLNLILYGN